MMTFVAERWVYFYQTPKNIQMSGSGFIIYQSKRGLRRPKVRHDKILLPKFMAFLIHPSLIKKWNSVRQIKFLIYGPAVKLSLLEFIKRAPLASSNLICASDPPFEKEPTLITDKIGAIKLLHNFWVHFYTNQKTNFSTFSDISGWKFK